MPHVGRGRRLRWPDTLFGRLALLLGVVVVISHILALTLMFELAPNPGGHPPAAQAVGGSHPGPVPAQLRDPQARAAPAWPGPASGMRAPQTPLLPVGWLADKPYVVAKPWPPAMPWGAQRPPPHEAAAPAQRPFYPFVLDVGVRLLVLLVAVWFGARWLAQPMRRLATAAQALGRDINRPPLPETGTFECREASRVFNHMQERIRQQLQDRDRLVAAVSHDLRTPLTRMRLRAELLDDAAMRHGLQQDVAEMEAMIHDTLDYLRGQAAGAPMVRVQLSALLQSMVDDRALVGEHIPLTGDCGPVQCQPGPLRRCVDNLITNALRYGGSAEVQLSESAQGVRITVRDHGPGLPESALQQVMEPFVRMEVSRHRHHGGVGLGLSIARDIALRHHGQLHLHNAPEGGLCAVLELPHAQPGRVAE